MTTIWPFVGRTGEITRIRRGLGDGGTIVVSGSAGIGKSRLIAEALAGVDREVIEVRAGQLPGTGFGALAHVLPAAAAQVEDPRTAAEQLAAMGGVIVADDVQVLDEPMWQVLAELQGLEGVRVLVAMETGEAGGAGLEGAEWIVPEPLPVDDLATLLGRVLGGPVTGDTVGELHRAVQGDLGFLKALLRAGRLTGMLSEGPHGDWRWNGEIVVPPGLRRYLEDRVVPGFVEMSPYEPLGLEVAIAAHAVLSPHDHVWADAVLTQAMEREDERARAVFWVTRATGTAWGLGRAEEADRMLDEAMVAFDEPDARQRALIQRAASDLHRALGRAALDGAADAREQADPEPEVAAQIAVVESLAAALTGQTAAGVQTAERALANVADWAVAAPECLPSLEFARSSALLARGELDAAEEHLDFGRDGDAVAFAAVRARVLRERGRLREALWQAWDGARRLQFSDSLFAGPCLGEVAQAAVLIGDLAGARAALTEAERRALPALRALWFPVALARPWVLAAQGALGAAVHDLLSVAAAAEELELRPYAMIALHDVVRLGAAGVVADRLVRLSDEVDGALSSLLARHAVAAAAGNAATLSEVSISLEELGLRVLAAEAAAQAAEAHWDQRESRAAGSRAWLLAQRCDRVRTPALATAAQPDVTLIQYEIAELAALGRSEAEIADRLDLQVRTVGEQLAVVRKRFGAVDQADLVTLFGP